MRTKFSVAVAALSLALLAAPASGAGPAVEAKSAKEQKIRKLIALTGGEELARSMLDAMLAELAKDPDAPAGVAEKFRELAAKEDLVSQYVPIYAAHLQEPELDAAITFYSSPMGQKFAKAQPGIVQDSMAAGSKWGASLAERAMKELQAKQR